jgi:hypothetical protein
MATANEARLMGRPYNIGIALIFSLLTALVDAAPRRPGAGGGFGTGGSDDDDNRKRKLNTGAIVGIVIGAVAAIVLLYLAYFVYTRRRKAKLLRAKEAPASTT